MDESTAAVLDAFDAESQTFRGLVADLSDAEWGLPTPAEGWSVRDQVAHVAFVFNLAATAASSPRAFADIVDSIPPGGFNDAVNAGLAPFGAGTTHQVLQRWDSTNAEVSDALAAHDPAEPVPWLVNPLPVPVLTVAGMIEMFAHGQDIADAVGSPVTRTDTLAFHAGFVHRTRDFGYLAHGLTPPTHEFRFEIDLPSGARLELGPADSPDVVCGSAEHLCLLATRRRHRDDLDVQAQGDEATRYLTLAQAYRGPAGPGREPGQFATRAA